MKTLFSFLSILALMIAISSLDSHRLDADVLFPALAVATVFAFALTEGRSPARPTLSERFTRSYGHLGSRPVGHRPSETGAAA
jgi:hypothetical protein